MSSGKFHTALTALAGLSIPGVTHNYALEAIPERLARASLPILFVLPMLDEMARHRLSEFAMASPTGAIGYVHYYCTHVLLYAPLGANRSTSAVLPGLTDLLDSYATVIRANSKLGGALFLPTDYIVMPGTLTWGGGLFFGARLIHHFTFEV